jgi:hypothetical protein
MDQHRGQPANEAIFAANGASRRRLLRTASAAFLALLAAWLIALALGVWSGFELLPGLPGSDSTSPTEAGSRIQQPPAQAPAHQSARAARTASPSPGGSGSGNGTTDPQGSSPNATAPKPVQSPSTSSAPPTSQGTTTTTEVPPDSPGNLPGGSEVPGQLP